MYTPRTYQDGDVWDGSAVNTFQRKVHTDAVDDVYSLLHPEFHGVNVQYVWDAGITTAAVLATLQAAGVGTARIEIKWSDVEAVQGTYDWTIPDTRMLALANNNIRPMVLLWDSPSWAKRYPASSHSGPSVAALAAWVTFAQAVVNRYGPNGSIWTASLANGELPQLYPRMYEIWNEPNAGNGYWWGTATVDHAGWAADLNAPTEYATLFQQTYNAIKAIDPNCKVIHGGVTGGPSSMGNGTWITRVYAAIPTLAADGLGVHPYATFVGGASLSDVKQLIHSYRVTIQTIPAIANLPLHVTEIGWAAATPDITTLTGTQPPLAATPGQEADRASKVLQMVQDFPYSLDNVQSVYIHTAVTAEDSTTDNNKWSGIISPNGVPKQSFYTWAAGVRPDTLRPGTLYSIRPVSVAGTANFTFALTDLGYAREVNNAGATTATIPAFSTTIPWPDGAVLEVVQTGAGVVNVAGAGGVTVPSIATAGVGTSIQLRKRPGTDVWSAQLIGASGGGGSITTYDAIPSDMGLVGWPLDYAYVTTQATPAGGVIWGSRIMVPSSITVTGVIIYTATAGSGTLTSGQNWAGVTNSAGSVLGKSASNAVETANPMVVGETTVNLSSPVAVTGGSSTYIYAFFLLNGATTYPSLSRLSTAVSTTMISRNIKRYVQVSGPSTTIAGSLTWSVGTVPFWIGIY